MRDFWLFLTLIDFLSRFFVCFWGIFEDTLVIWLRICFLIGFWFSFGRDSSFLLFFMLPKIRHPRMLSPPHGTHFIKGCNLYFFLNLLETTFENWIWAWPSTVVSYLSEISYHESAPNFYCRISVVHAHLGSFAVSGANVDRKWWKWVDDFFQANFKCYFIWTQPN